MVARPARTLALVVALLAGLAGAGSAPASAQSAPPEREALRDRLLDAAGGRGRLSEHPRTDTLRFFGTGLDRPVPRARNVAAGASPEAGARGFLATYGSLFGADDARRDLRATAIREAEAGRSSVRFQQLHRGVPVFGGELVVNLDGDRNVLSANGELSPKTSLDVEPAVAPANAAVQARTAVAKQHGIDVRVLEATPPELWVYDPVLLGAPDRPGARLVWRTEITSDDQEMRELVLVDARNGGITLNVDQVAHARSRVVCDRANAIGVSETCVAPYTRTEGAPATGIADVDRVYDYSGHVYDYYMSTFGRDSLNGAGMPLTSTVRYCEPGGCPYPNAFWNGSQVTVGQGFVADDIVAHEFTHGVTQYESRLFAHYQSGAIGESLSDVFGEFIDLGNGVGNDTLGVRWLLGEDLPSGAIRNMANPPALGGPDSMTSPNYVTERSDHGGIHKNAGVSNKAAFLMTDGGTFNGITVAGLGMTKVAHIYYEANANLLTSGSDYLDLFHALRQACLNKVGVVGITAANCAEVEKAVTATRMDTPAPGGAAEAPMCPGGAAANTIFLDDMENTASGNWIFGGTGAGGWSFDDGYATSGTRDMYAADPPTASDRTSTRSAPVVPQAGQTTYLRFNHAYETEANFDGGVVEYSTNGGGSWVDAGSLFTHNGYNRTNTMGPLAGRRVFGDRSMGYGSSRLDLSSLAGQSVVFRYRFATDATIGGPGWDIDDVRVYTCAQSSAAPAITSASGTTFTVGSPGTFTVTATGTPAPTLSVEGTLPAGVTFNPATGVLSGTPAAGSAGSYDLTFAAANGVLPRATQGFTLTVLAPTVATTDFNPLPPARILDTRSGVGGHAGKLFAGETANVAVTGVGGVPASGVESVVLNVTATEATTSTFLTVFPAGQTRPFASNVNVMPNQDVPNLVVAKVGADGRVALYNNLGSVHVIFDVVGWYRPAPACFTSLTPARILDSRTSAKVGPGQTLDVRVTGVGGVPASGVGAVVVNVTATAASATTFLTVFPTGQARPFASNLNVVPARDIPNLVVAKVGADGNVSVYNNLGETDVIFDVVGWHPSAAPCFSSLTPARIFDSRSTTRLAPGESRVVKVTGTGGVPATGVGAVVLNVTATEATASTFLTVFPSGETRPLASNVNVVPNQDIPNLVVAKVGANGSVTVYNNLGSTHTIFDVVGYYPG